MKGENKYINFICALIPGVGFLYNGLYKKGISFVVLWFFLVNIGDLIGLRFLTSIIGIAVWFYCFFKTFDINKKVLNGEYVEDEYLFQKQGYNVKYIGIALVVIGGIAILRNLFQDFFVHLSIFTFIKPYIIPLVFIIIGLTILLDHFRRE